MDMPSGTVMSKILRKKDAVQINQTRLRPNPNPCYWRPNEPSQQSEDGVMPVLGPIWWNFAQLLKPHTSPGAQPSLSLVSQSVRVVGYIYPQVCLLTFFQFHSLHTNRRRQCRTRLWSRTEGRTSRTVCGLCRNCLEDSQCPRNIPLWIARAKQAFVNTCAVERIYSWPRDVNAGSSICECG